ncbi:vascular cell adhesion protein 1 isoform X2 [Lissotriton helveticus]
MRVARIPRASLALCVFLLGILSAEGFKATLLPKSWVAVPHGGTLVLVCTVTGCEPDKPVFFVWRGTGDSSLGGATSTVGHQSNLTVAPVGFDNAQTYICLASCGSERRQTKTDVDVYSLSSDPVISSTPLVAGVPAALTCEVTDVFPSRRCTLRLIRNSHEVEKRTYEDIDDSVEDKTTTLRLQHKFTPFVEDDGTDILCQAQMSFEDPRMEMKPKKRQRSMTLNVNYAPQSVVISESPSATVREGDHLTLNCVAKSNPPPRMTWTKELEKGRVPIGEGDTITFNRANMSDSGVYICEANNEVGSHSTTTEIIVQGPPRSTTLAVYPNATVKAGDIVNITCTSLGEPAPHITLRKKSEAGFTTDQRPYIVLKAEEEHTGVYECESSNDLGSQRTELKLVVQATYPSTTIRLPPAEKDPKEKSTTVPPSTIVWSEDEALIVSRNSTVASFAVVNDDVGTDTADNYIIPGNETQEVKILFSEPESLKDVYVGISVLTCIAVMSVLAIIAAVHFSKQAKSKGSYSLANPLKTKV